MNRRTGKKEELIHELNLLHDQVENIEKDIINWKRLQDALRENEARLKEVQQFAHIGHWEWKPQSGELFWSDETCSILGISCDTIPSLEAFFKVIHPADLNVVKNSINESLHGKKPYNLDIRIIRQDQSERVVNARGEVEYDDSEKPVRMFGTVLDITERKQAEEALKRSEERYHDLFENANDAIFLVDARQNYVDANKKAVELLGYSREELLRMNIFDFIPEEQKPRSTAEFTKLRQRGRYEKFRGKLRTRDGRWLDIEVSSSAIMDRGTYVGSRDIVRDITEQVSAEKALRESESRLKEAQQIARIGNWAWDIRTNKVEWSDELYRMYGYKPNEMDPDYELMVKTMHPDSRQKFLDAVDAALKGKKPFDMDYSFFRKDGSIGVLHSIGKVIYNGNRAPERLVGTVQDITDRKKAEESLLLFRNLLNQSEDAIFVTDPATGRFLIANDKACSNLGYGRSELLAMRTLDIEATFPDQAAWDAHVDEVKSQGHMIVEGVHKRNDGALFPVEVNVTYMTLGGKDYMVAVARDITERKRAAEALRRSETMLQAIIDTEPECVKLLDSEGRLIMMNRAGLAMIEVESLEQVRGQCVYPIVAPEYREPFVELTKNVFQGRSGSLLFEMVGAKGTRRWLDTHAVPFRNEKNEVVALLAVTRDVTERKAAEQALRISEERLSKAQKMAHVGNWEWNLVTNEMYWSEEVYHIYGVDPAQFIPTFDAVGKAMHPDDLEPFTQAVNAAIYERKPFEMDYRLIRPDGTVRTVHSIGEVSYDPAGKPLVKSGTVQDITDRKLADEKLRQSEKFTRNILETVDEGIIVIDKDFRILTANKAYCRQVGAAGGDVIGRHCYEISHRATAPCHEQGEECAVRYVFDTGEPYTALHRHAGPDESLLYVETKAFPVKDSSGAVTSVIETINNITEKHLLEEVRLKTQKLEAIGTLAGGIAHDFNNLLQGVFGYLSLARMVHDRKERSLAMLEQAERALHMCVNLTKQLLTFSKGGMPVKRPLAIGQVIEDFVKFALSGSSVDYRIILDDDLPMTEADEGQLAQAIQNIVLNASQAMPAGGTVLVTVKKVSLPKKGKHQLLEEGYYLEIAIEDSGTGIPDQNLDKIFDPYFSTKEKGSGLGLATAYSIIKNHGGMINVLSEVNRGSTFFIYLPALEGQQQAVPQISAAVPPGRKGKILVMDDEELIRNILGEMIKSDGHEVEFAEHGEEAIERYLAARKSGSPFDVVILDLTIRGGLGGKETMERLCEIDPGVKAVVSSGYSDGPVVADYRKYRFAACLTKPYKFEDLTNTLNVLLS